jgi:hypothetical protein
LEFELRLRQLKQFLKDRPGKTFLRLVFKEPHADHDQLSFIKQQTSRAFASGHSIGKVSTCLIVNYLVDIGGQ